MDPEPPKRSRILATLAVNETADFRLLLREICGGWNGEEIPGAKVIIWILESLRNHQQAQIAIRLFGLDGQNQRSYSEVASEMGSYSDTIRKYKDRIIKRLRKMPRVMVLLGKRSIREGESMLKYYQGSKPYY